MKNTILYIFLISLLALSTLAETNPFATNDIPCLSGDGPLLLGQEYCDESTTSFFNFLSPDHYELSLISTFTHYFNIEQDENDPLNIYVNFGFDLNNPNPTKSADYYRIVEEYEFYNYIRPSTSKTRIDNFYDYRISTNDFESLNKDDYDFIGAPAHLVSCFLDCNVNDNTPAIKFDLTNIEDVLFLNIADTYDPNTGDLVPYDWISDRFDLKRELIVPYTLRFENNYYQCSYDTTGTKSVSMGCTVEADTFLRYPNIDTVFGDWDLTDVLPESFPSGAENKERWTIQKRIEVDIDNLNYSVTVTTQDPSGGGYIPPTGEGLLGQEFNNVNIEEQKAIYSLKETAELENIWQTNLLNLTDIIFILIMIVFYLFSLFVLSFFFFGSLPYIFRKFNDKLNDLASFKRGK